METQVLTFTIPAMTAIFAAVFAVLWWQDRSRLYVLAYGYWFAAVATNIVLQVWVFEQYGPVEVLIFHANSALGLLALLWGVSTRNNIRLPLGAMAAASVGTGAVVWFAVAHEEQTVVLMSQNFNAALMFAFGAHCCWQSNRRHMADKALLAAFLLLTAYAMFRPGITMVIASSMTMAEYQDSPILTVHMGITVVLCLLISLALIATVISDRMDEDAEKATQDALTGLPTRGAFNALAQDMLERASAERVQVSLVVGDIDHFKRINDTYGHNTGDKVITDFGRLIASRVRPHDAAGRIGGEEFCILAWNCDEAGAAALAERLRIAFHDMGHEALPQEEVTSASFGVAEIRSGSDYSDVFERADAALYKAKRAGRNRVMGDQIGEFDPLKPSDEHQDVAASKILETVGAEIVTLAHRKAR